MIEKIYRFRPKIEIQTEVGSFILKTITDTEELIQALRLRYQIFHREMKGVKRDRGIDTDEYDFLCDHLAIIDKNSSKVVGTYRINCTLFSNKFYSEREFHLDNLFKCPGTKIELGRACIEKAYRRGAVIALLWRGIAEYMSKVNAAYLFGCASVVVQDPREVALLYKYFEEQNKFNSQYFCPPTKNYTMPKLDLWIRNLNRTLTEEEIKEAEEKIPALCRAYIKAGAFLGGEPAWDKEFNCIDFLTILPRVDINKGLEKKYVPRMGAV
ncbi:MAG: GNAT family N-acetyltransferase [Oligoflexia bacterium]|nr:GNAT family N-acetyltransferase [Oligoflexia bacterium]